MKRKVLIDYSDIPRVRLYWMEKTILDEIDHILEAYENGEVKLRMGHVYAEFEQLGSSSTDRRTLARLADQAYKSIHYKKKYYGKCSEHMNIRKGTNTLSVEYDEAPTKEIEALREELKPLFKWASWSHLLGKYGD